MLSPNVSVLMSVHNGEKFISEAINSVLNQSYQEFEFIIINNNSEDETSSIISKFNDPRINLYNLSEKLNLSEALNYGLKNCDSELIARIDSDDIMMPTRLERQVKFFKKYSKISLLGSAIERIFENGEHRDFVYYPQNHDEILKAVARMCPFAHPSVMYKRSIVKKLGYYSESFSYAQDFELWIKFLKDYTTANLKYPLTKYRTHSLQNSYKVAPESVKIYENILQDKVLCKYIDVNHAKFTLNRWKAVPDENLNSKLRKKKWSTWMRSADKDYKIALYGGGNHTETLLHEIDSIKSKNKPFVILDKNPSRNYINGIPVIATDLFDYQSADVFVVSSYFYNEEIINLLKKSVPKSRILSFYKETF